MWDLWESEKFSNKSFDLTGKLKGRLVFITNNDFVAVSRHKHE